MQAGFDVVALMGVVLSILAMVFMFSLPFSGAREPAAVIQNQAAFAWLSSAVPNSTPGGGWKGLPTSLASEIRSY